MWPVVGACVLVRRLCSRSLNNDVGSLLSNPVSSTTQQSGQRIDLVSSHHIHNMSSISEHALDPLFLLLVTSCACVANLIVGSGAAPYGIASQRPDRTHLSTVGPSLVCTSFITLMRPNRRHSWLMAIPKTTRSVVSPMFHGDPSNPPTSPGANHSQPVCLSGFDDENTALWTPLNAKC